MTDQLKIIECPRDAMQGIEPLIATSEKVRLLESMLRVGFPVIDFGSFVSPKAVPQMADTAAVLDRLTPNGTKLLAIIANRRGAEIAVAKNKVAVLGYPLSISETFQQRNSNKTIVASLEELVGIIDLADKNGKELVVYLSMAFGNPYGDPYSIEIAAQFAGVLSSLGVATIAISDTVGLATPKQVDELYSTLSREYPGIEWGIHLHASPDDTEKKIKAALLAGCRRIDGAILGFGGCPMAEDKLIGNINTRAIITIAEELGLSHDLDLERFTEAEKIAGEVFNPVKRD